MSLGHSRIHRPLDADREARRHASPVPPQRGRWPVPRRARCCVAPHSDRRAEPKGRPDRVPVVDRAFQSRVARVVPGRAARGTRRGKVARPDLVGKARHPAPADRGPHPARALRVRRPDPHRRVPPPAPEARPPHLRGRLVPPHSAPDSPPAQRHTFRAALPPDRVPRDSPSSRADPGVCHREPSPSVVRVRRPARAANPPLPQRLAPASRSGTTPSRPPAVAVAATSR